MLRYKSLDRSYGYNLRCDAKGGMIISQSTSEKISKRLKEEWASGVRCQHSEKLKESWQVRDREAQSQLFSKSLTKWLYFIEGAKEPVLYKGLCELGFKNAFAKFYKKGADDIIFKGVSIVRKRLTDEG